MTEVLQTPKLVTVFGGAGFLGRHVVRALAKRGYLVRAACRNPNAANYLLPLGNVGQVQPVQANLRVRWSVDRAVEGADVVVNLVAILFESGRQSFEAVHDFGARAVAEATRAAGARLVHVSAIGADPESDSDYARTKGLGERAVFETLPDSVVFRQSFMFGPEDRFFNKFANMARFTPAMPLIGGDVRSQPVFVADVAEAIAKAVDGQAEPGKIYELGGTQVLTMRESFEEMLAAIERKRWLVPVPWWAANLQASILGLLPNPLLTTDQVKMLQKDNVVSDAAIAEGRTFAGLDIKPRTLASILPSYLWRYRTAGQFTKRSEV